MTRAEVLGGGGGGGGLFSFFCSTACKHMFFIKAFWMRCSEILLIKKFLNLLELQLGYSGPKNVRPRIF